MKITINGTDHEVSPGLSLRDLLPKDSRGTATAVNDIVVSRELVASTGLAPGDRVEIVTAVPGG